MKKIIFIFLFLSMSVSVFSQQAALGLVLSIPEESRIQEKAELAYGIVLENLKLYGSKDYRIIDIQGREDALVEIYSRDVGLRITEIVEKHKFAFSQYLCLFQFKEEGERLYFSAKIINTSTTELVSASSGKCKDFSEFKEAVNYSIAQLFGRKAIGRLSLASSLPGLILPGTSQLITKQSKKGAFMLGSSLILLGGGLTFTFLANNNWQKSKAPGVNDAERIFYYQRFQQMLIPGVACLGLYFIEGIWSLIDNSHYVIKMNKRFE